MLISKEEKLLMQLKACCKVSEVVNKIEDRETVPRLIMDVITHPEGLGYDRALLFKTDDKSHMLNLYMARGPTDRLEAANLRQQTPDPTSEKIDDYLNSTDVLAPVSRANAWTERLGGFMAPTNLVMTDFVETDEQVPLQVMVGKCASNRQPYFSNHTKVIFEPPPAFSKEILQFQRLATMPLITSEGLLGVLMVDNFFNQRDITDIDLQGLMILANLCVTAIENIEVHKKLQASTQLDGATGTYNRQHFEASLDLEIDRARKAGKPLSLLAFHLHNYIDLYNEFGWYRAAKLMKELAVFLQKSVRSEDMIVRFGRADFMVLLTGGAVTKDSVSVGEKLLSEMTELELGNLSPGTIHISAGLVSLTPAKINRKNVSLMAEEALDCAIQQRPGILFSLQPDLI